MEGQQKTPKEKKSEHDRLYRIRHKEEISERRKQKIICSCGQEVCKRHLASHLGRSRHLKQLQNIQSPQENT